MRSDFTLIGTTDKEYTGSPADVECSDQEVEYLCRFASEYFATPVTRADVVWTYSGVRPLYDDGATSATAATRDYVLSLDTNGPAPLLNVFGGKITTHRRLAEAALAKLAPFFPKAGPAWTAGVALPGGDFQVDGVAGLISSLRSNYGFLDDFWARRMVKAYGTDAWAVLGGAKAATDLGETFGATLTAREIIWLIREEFAHTAEDVLWRRSKLGLRLNEKEVDALNHWMKGHREAAA